MKRIFTVVIALFCSSQLYAQAIKFHDVNPDTTINYWEVFGVQGVDIWWHPTPEVVVRTWDTYEVLSGTDTLPLALNYGDDISAASGDIWAKQNYRCLNCGGSAGYWVGVTDKYLAFRYKDNGQYRYGWIRLSIPPGAASFTIKDYAVQTKDNTAIKAGQVFATGIGLLNGGGDITLVTESRTLWFKGIAGQAEVRVTDMGGRVVERRTIKGKEAIDMSAHGAGMYIIHIYTSGIEKVGKIVLR